jgi:hypothetical protein
MYQVLLKKGRVEGSPAADGSAPAPRGVARRARHLCGSGHGQPCWRRAEEGGSVR